MRSNIYSKFISVILVLMLLLCINPTLISASEYESVEGESQTENSAGTATSEEESAEATKSENPIDSVEAELSADVTYAPQPSTLEEVQAVIDAYEAEYQAALESEGFMAALEVQKPHWQYALTEELMPEGYNCQLVDWDESFGGEYYTFFPNPVATATHTISAGASPSTIQSTINSAASGDTIVFNGSNVALTAALTVNKSLTFQAASGTVIIRSANNARHITVPANSGAITLTFSGVELQGNAATIANNLSNEIHIGGIKVNPNSALTVVGAKIYDCKSNYYGGAIDAQSNLTLTNCDIYNNYNPFRNGYAISAGGGGVAVRSDDTITGLELTLNNTKIRDNTTLVSGGGILLAAEDMVVKIENQSEIINNTADGGGGIYAFHGGAQIHIKDFSKVNDNTSRSWSGGGIYLLSINNTLEIEDSEIANNSAASSGGGIYLDNGQVQSSYAYVKAPLATTIKISDSDITGNAAGGSGGGIYVNGNRKIHQNYQNSADNALPAELIFSGVTISGNTANNNGGGVYLAGSNLTVDGGSSISNNGGAVTVKGTTYGSVKDGGGVYAASAQYTGLYSFGSGTGTLVSGTDSTFIKQIASTFTLAEGTVEKNTATTKGGGVCLYGLGASCLAKFNMKSNAVVNQCSAAKGGGVYAEGGILTMTDTAVVQECNADVFGGGVCFEGVGGSIEMDADSAVSGNQVYWSGTGLESGHGGGIYLGANANTGNTKLTMSDKAQISDNEVSGASASAAGFYGGGIYITPTCKATMKGSAVVRGNTAFNAGGVFTDGELIMSDSARIEDCEAVGGTVGGGICCGPQGSVTLEDSAIVQRNRAYQGAGVAVTGGLLTMTGGTIYDNTASTSGGGVYINRDVHTTTGGEFHMSGGLIDKNKASSYGGGVFVTGAVNEEGICTMTGGTVSNNIANSRGGGVYLSTYSTFTVNETDTLSKITGNETVEGGGVYVRQYSEFEMSAGTIEKNTASTNGGGVFLDAETAVFTMSGGTIGGSGNANTADTHGGGAYINAGTFKVTDGAISNNTASKDGGGIYTTVSGIVNVAKATISNNTATGDGGGIYTVAADYVTSGGAYANLTVATSVTFSGNTAGKAYMPLDATKTPYDSYWTTIQNSSFSSGVTVPVVSRLASVNNYDINASLVLVKFDTNGGDYYVNGAVGTIPDQSHTWNVMVTDPESVVNSEMYQKDYEFVGWTLTGSSTIWDFSADQVTSTADAADGTSDEIINLVAKWEEIKGTITINKYKDDGTSSLEGVTFTLTDDNTGTVVDTVTTDSSGVATFTNLPTGEYTITETKAPQGYSLLAESFEATIPQDVTGTSYAGATKQTTPDGTTTFGYDLTYKVTNQASFALPEAGAADIWNQYGLWIGLALLLAGGSSAAWWMKRRGRQRAV